MQTGSHTASKHKFVVLNQRQVCHLSAQPRFGTFHQHHNIAEMLSFLSVLHTGRSRQARKAVKALPVEMLEQCLSRDSCRLTSILMDEHYTVCQHSTLLFWLALSICLESRNKFRRYSGPSLYKYHHITNSCSSKQLLSVFWNRTFV
jgi:hypothetical protein